jgi:hypothetical protein
VSNLALFQPEESFALDGGARFYVGSPMVSDHGLQHRGQPWFVAKVVHGQQTEWVTFQMTQLHGYVKVEQLDTG